MGDRELTVEANRRDLLQTFRAVQAIAEVDWTVLVPNEEKARWEYAAEWFDLPFRVGEGAPRITIEVDHKEPRVRVGDITRPLVFPHRALELYRGAWAADRTIWVSFAGRMSDGRRRVIRRWATDNGIRIRTRGRSRADCAYVRSTSFGREWPGKAWDPGYVRGLGESRFVLCPDGDFVWTYRFFEAALAGAIPVIQSKCDLYEGFTLASMDQPVDTLEWSEAAAMRNFERARQMLTVPREDLRQAIYSALNDG